MDLHRHLELHLLLMRKQRHPSKSNCQREFHCQNTTHVHEYHENCHRTRRILANTYLWIFAEGIQLADLFDRGWMRKQYHFSFTLIIRC